MVLICIPAFSDPESTLSPFFVGWGKDLISLTSLEAPHRAGEGQSGSMEERCGFALPPGGRWPSLF